MTILAPKYRARASAENRIIFLAGLLVGGVLGFIFGLMAGI